MEDWPVAQNPPSAWDGSRIRTDEHYTYVLSSGEIKEIDDALEHFKGTKTLDILGRVANKC
jgi:hypothetical protein